MTSAKNIKAVQPIVIDPNFFLPPSVVDMRYANLEDANDSATTRDSDTGEVVNVDYNDMEFSDFEDTPDSVGTGTVSSILSPPDTVSVVSQQVRVTSDGRFVVDIILDVDDIPGAVQYDVRLTKP